MCHVQSLEKDFYLGALGSFYLCFHPIVGNIGLLWHTIQHINCKTFTSTFDPSLTLIFFQHKDFLPWGFQLIICSCNFFRITCIMFHHFLIVNLTIFQTFQIFYFHFYFILYNLIFIHEDLKTFFHMD
jgi:hypothetical protein